MLKKTLLFGTLATSAFMLTACSGDGDYDKLMEKADKAMEDFKVEEAIKQYEKILKLDFKDIAYGGSRQMIVEQLLDSAYALQDEFDELTEVSDNALALSDKIDFDKSSLTEIYETYQVIAGAVSRIKEYPSFPTYQKLVELDQKFSTNLEDKVVPRVLEEVEGLIAEYRFEEASELLYELSEIGYLQPALDLESKIAKLQEKIEADKERFERYPIDYTKRDVVVYEDASIGKVTFLGEGTEDNEKRVYFKFEGDIAIAASDLDMEVRAIFEDGSNRTSSGGRTDLYDGYVVKSFDVDNETSLKRLDYRLDFANMEDYKSIVVEESKDTATLPAILRVTDDQTYESDIVIEDEVKKIDVNNIVIGSGSMNFHLTVTAKKDFKMDETAVVVARTQVDASTSYDSIYDEFFMGIPKDVELNVDIAGSLLENDKYVRVYLFNTPYVIDVTNGKVVSPETDLLGLMVSNVHEGSLSIYQLLNNYSDSVLFEDTAGKKYVNVVALKNGYSVEEPTLGFNIGKNYKKFSAEIALSKEYQGTEFGSSELIILGDGKELQKVSIKPGHKTLPIEVDVTNIQTLEFTLNQIVGTEDYQQILIGNGKFTN